ncbi:MAG: endonuclease III [Bacteroidales bacterium]|nr:endonuclease III [Bacteroidales bacterium]
MTLKEKYKGIIEWFEQNMPVAQSELNYNNGYQLIVAVILSAQCTDKRVNIVTPSLFLKYPDFDSLSQAQFEELFPLIKSISYPNSKTRHLIEMAKKIREDFDGIIPSEIDLLTTIPGVGRKTANVVASILYDKPVIAVDTHVHRISNRLGLSKGTTPEKVEKDLTRQIPLEKRAIAHHWLILHGRYVCTARKPKCQSCGLQQWCSSFPLG